MKSAMNPIELFNCKEKPIPMNIAIGNISLIEFGVKKNIGTLPKVTNITLKKN